MARVLIVEPSADVRALLERAVRRCGHEALVHDPRSSAEVPGVDVLLLEPAYTGGIELARRLRSQTPRLPIVICSILPPSAELRAVGAVAHVLKPFRRGALERALAAAVAAA